MAVKQLLGRVSSPRDPQRGQTATSTGLTKQEDTVTHQPSKATGQAMTHQISGTRGHSLTH
ncbi:hypothetical protein E2C01_083274 [Portunus trituberculatus]|uniref:Uncharacterized protein n=1 Tax=Portunus trituberculatus TaxID=210409 RepID=A0A5B7J7D3_PORTR|nr:hypothetical protein [Portunus trituberculatus]